MMRVLRAALRLLTILVVLFSLSTCEFLFYSPAFMPAVSETELFVGGGLFEERYKNHDQTATGTSTFADPTLNFFINNNISSVPALDAVMVGNESWSGVSDFLGIFFGGRTLYGDTASYGGTFHGIGVTFDYDSFTVTEFDLPFAAVEGIDENGPTRKLEGALAVARVRTYSTYDELSGEGTFVFGAGPKYGLLYMVYYHDNGITTVAYQKTIDSAVASDYFPDGNYTYVINVFQD
jgi:hypothetical protein